MAVLHLAVETRSNFGPIVTTSLSLPTSELTAADLIAEQVRSSTAGLAQADQDEAVCQALAAFRRGAFLFIVDGRRCTELEERVNVTPETRLQFWRLMLLQGG